MVCRFLPLPQFREPAICCRASFAIVTYGLASAFRAVKYLRRGDVDDSRTIDSLDVDYLLEYLNNNGPDPIPIYDLGDVDCSGSINMVDVNYLINYLDSSGPAPGCL